MRNRDLIAVAAWFLGGVAVSAQAESLGTSVQRVREQALVEAQAKAAEWLIEPTDWLRYRELMAGPRGAWSPNADPLTVLGASAPSQSERRRFAEAFVRMEFQRVQGELAFQREVNEAWKRYFPGRLRLAGMSAGSSKLAKHKTRSAGRTTTIEPRRYALVLEANCTACLPVLREYLNQARSSRVQGFAVDLYLRKTGNDDKVLRDWVADSEVPISLIRAGSITINHGDKYAGGDVPQVWAQLDNGDWVLQ